MSSVVVRLDTLSMLKILILSIIVYPSFRVFSTFTYNSSSRLQNDYVEATVNASKEMLYHLYWIFLPDSLWSFTPSDVRFRRNVRLLQKKADELIRRRQEEIQSEKNNIKKGATEEL